MYCFLFFLCFPRLSFFSSFPVTRSPGVSNVTPFFPLFTVLSSFTLSLSYQGFLQITPEASQKAQLKGEIGGEADVSGSFCQHMSGLDSAAMTVSTDHQQSATTAGTITTVTKTTRITKHMVTTETLTGQTSKSTTTKQMFKQE